MNGPVADFWSEQSSGAIRIATAPGNDPAWVQATVDCSDPYGLWSQAAAHADWTAGPGKHLLVYLPHNGSGCAYGLAQVSSSLTAGGKRYVTDVGTSVMAYEPGHNFGLGHSSAQQCDGSVDGGSCRTVAHRDYDDVMGASWDQLGSLNVARADRIGLLPAGQQQLVSTTAAAAQYTLAPVSGSTGTRGIRLTDASGVDYWPGCRPRQVATTGWRRSPWTGPGLQSGVLLRRILDSPNDTSLLLDGTPSAPTGWDADLQTALPVGTTVPVDDGGFTVTVQSATSTAATVRLEPLPDSVQPFPRDWNGDARSDLLAAHAAGGMSMYPSALGGGFGPRSVIGVGWQIRDVILLAGDWDGDGQRELIARNPANGDLQLYPPDLLARRRADGALFLYRGNGLGGWLGGAQVGNGWHGITALAVGGDCDGDGLVDLISRNRSGSLWPYQSNGRGGFGAARVIGQGWQGITQLVSPGDWDGHGHPDLLPTRADGSLWLYRGRCGRMAGAASDRLGLDWLPHRHLSPTEPGLWSG